MKQIITATALLVSMWVGGHADTRPGVVFQGSLYSDLHLYHTLRSDTDDTAYFGGTSLLTLVAENGNQKQAKVRAAADVITLYGSHAESLFGGLSGRVPVFSEAPVLVDLRELYLSLYLPFADVVLGRQIVNFGKGMLFSPLDVFSSVDVLDVAFRRRGSDIASVRVPLGMLSGIDIIAQLPLPQTSATLAAKGFGTLFDMDLSVIAMYRTASDEAAVPIEDSLVEGNSSVTAEEEYLVGAGVKGDLVAGWYLEAVEHFAGGVDTRYFEGMVGADYSVNNRWFFTGEYLYRCSGAPEDPLWDEHNGFFSVRYAINDLMSASATGIGSFPREFLLVTLQYSYNVLQNTNLILYLRGMNNLPQISAESPDLEYALRIEVAF